MAESPRRPRSVPPSPSHLHTDRSLLPVGITTILPDAAARVRELERVLVGVLGAWGYREIILPAFEFLDVLTPGLHAQIIEKGYQLTDRTTGRTLVLRPDATAQIARTVAMGMLGEELPLRLAYRTSVFRYEPEHVGRDREQLQIGGELIGMSGAAGDAEIIALMVECLRGLGVKSFRISLGHVGFLQAILRGSGLTPDDQKHAEQAAARRDIPELERIVSGGRVSRTYARAILEAPGLYGSEEILARGRSLVGRNSEARAALDRLASVHRLLEAAGCGDYLLLDLGELRGFDYYDGIVFDVFADGIGYEIGGGGRYDHLIGQFGRTLPSTGFAFDVDRLFRVVDVVDSIRASNGANCLVSAPTGMTGAVMAAAQRLRAAGVGAIHGTPMTKGPGALGEVCAEARRLHARAVVCFGISPLKADEALVVRDVNGTGAVATPTVATLRTAGALVVRLEAVAGVLGRRS